MRAKTFTVTASAGGASTSPVYPVDTYENPCNIGIGVTVTGSAVYTVQHTFADPWSQNLNTATVTWLNNDILTSANTNADTNYAFYPRAIRLSLAAATSATAVMTIQQAGPND